MIFGRQGAEYRYMESNQQDLHDFVDGERAFQVMLDREINVGFVHYTFRRKISRRPLLLTNISGDADFYHGH